MDKKMGHGRCNSSRAAAIPGKLGGCISEFEAELHEMAIDEEAQVCAAQPTPTCRALKVLGLVASWWCSAVFITLLIKNMVGADGTFPYTFALTGLTNTSTGLLAWLFTRFQWRAAPLPPVQKGEVLKLTIIGVIQGMEIACNNKSLEYLSVSARTMNSSTSVLFMMVTARLWGLERLGGMRLGAALLLTLGGALQGLSAGGSAEHAGEVEAYLKGILLQYVAMCASSQRWALIQLITQQSPEGSALAQMAKSKLHLVQRTLPITGIVCFILSLCFEARYIVRGDLFTYDLLEKVLAIAAGIIVLTVAELEIVRVTSAVAMQILGTLHQIPVALAGVLFFQERVRALSACGFAFSLLGGLCYVRANNDDLPAAAVQASFEGLPRSEIMGHVQASKEIQDSTMAPSDLRSDGWWVDQRCNRSG